MSFETLTGGPDSPIPIGINGAPGRIATQALLQMLDRDDFVPVMANTREGTLAERWGGDEGLQNDEFYGPTGVTELVEVSPCDLGVTVHRGKGVTTNAISFLDPNGRKTSIIGSAEERPEYTHWSMFKSNRQGQGSYVGRNREEVSAAMRYLTVLDASPLKVDSSSGQRRAPKHRHPGLHLNAGARLVVVTSPFNPNNKLYLDQHRVETTIDGVNADPATLEALLAEGVRCFSASSCSTGALMTLLRAVREGGFDISEIDAFISHSNTESDKGKPEAKHARPSSSGSQREVGRLLPTIGIKIKPSALAIDVQRLPVDVGSLIRAKIKIPGGVPSDFIECLKQGVRDAGMERVVGFTESPITTGSIRDDRHTVMINEDIDIRRSGRATVIRLNSGFQNEKGYSERVLGLAQTLASTLRGMDEAGETSGN